MKPALLVAVHGQVLPVATKLILPVPALADKAALVVGRKNAHGVGAEEIFAMKASTLPPLEGCSGFTVGKLVEAVRPSTYAWPFESTSISKPVSSPPPPR